MIGDSKIVLLDEPTSGMDTTTSDLSIKIVCPSNIGITSSIIVPSPSNLSYIGGAGAGSVDIVVGDFTSADAPCVVQKYELDSSSDSAFSQTGCSSPDTSTACKTVQLSTSSNGLKAAAAGGARCPWAGGRGA